MKRLITLGLVLLVSAPAMTQESSIYNRRGDDTGSSGIYVPPNRQLNTNTITRDRPATQSARTNNAPITARYATAAAPDKPFSEDYTPYTRIPRQTTDQIYAYSHPPETVETAQHVDHYNDLPRVKALKEMITALNEPAPVPRIKDIGIYTFQAPVSQNLNTQSVNSAQSPQNTPKAVQDKPKATLYNRLKNNAQSRVWKLWGKNR